MKIIGIILNVLKEIKSSIPNNIKYDAHCLHFAVVMMKHKVLKVSKCSLAGQRYICFGDQYSSAHAEINCLKFIPHHKLFNRRFTSKLSIYVVRYDYKNLLEGKFKLLESEPCHHCLMTLSKYNITKIVYSNKDGNLIRNKIQYFPFPKLSALSLSPNNFTFMSSAQRRLQNQIERERKGER